MNDENISFTKNSDVFIKFLIENNFNFCIVTNTSKETPEIFKQKLPLLNEIKQWVYREDYILPKPDGECYELAKQKFYTNEKNRYYNNSKSKNNTKHNPSTTSALSSATNKFLKCIGIEHVVYARVSIVCLYTASLQFATLPCTFWF